MSLSTRDQILNSAEILFSEKGFDGVGIREITQHAGVNVAAIHYHFGSKEELFIEMVRRVVEPLNAVRMQRIEAIMAADPKPPFRDLVAALVEPMIEAMGAAGGLEPYRMIMAARVYTESAEVAQLMQDQLFGDLKRRFAAAVMSYFPEVPKELVVGRVFLLVSMFIGTMVQSRRFLDLDDSGNSLERLKQVWRDMINFAAAGFDAPFLAAAREEESE